MRYLVVSKKIIHYSCEDRDVMIMLNDATVSHLSVFSILEAFFSFFKYKMRYLVVSKKNNPLFV